ncbi:hypothetical protein MMB232_01669 [Brevundimonas subvibrioides]|jgi:uncharacterized membrane protein|uniref:DUF2177 domain-containing protein n=1 Tax=Brevundimonas subvibrioides (strain ATCC 15264 / DSM 4735 / LMG 14903 / NBRC 16000 / CB 81) TaxID=633149 RepID=D9QH68_BRESC|nr:DUF2177 family protein [Brevundimonas subvibrioides]ADL01034.1 Protein of unknown function DUF2177, membrane [Brevundimonas subvibrioides ATCC 15264]
MLKWIVAYLSTGVAMAVVDFGWLTTMTDRLYKPVIGPIMAPKPDMVAAVIFYLIYVGGIVFLAVAPALKEGAWTRAAINGAALGFVAYATYDLTNQATLQVWQWKLTIIDLCWGTFLTMASATLGYLATSALTGRA